MRPPPETDRKETVRHPSPPSPGWAELDALVERVRGTGLHVTLARRGRPFAVSEAAGLTVYRIVQEALTNALKHAEDPRLVEVRLDFDDPDVSVRVTDDGRTEVGARRGSSDHEKAAAGSFRTRAGLARAHAKSHGKGHAGATAIPPGSSIPAGSAGSADTGSPGWPSAPPPSVARSRPGRSPAGGWEVRAVLRDCKAPARA